jgi:CheY-like chemotaxis protein
MAMPLNVGVVATRRALVVDDEETVGQIMGYVLQGLGYQVDHVLDGHEALRMAREHCYDAVVCDLLMPGVNGMALYAAWQDENPQLARRVIFVTGDSLGTDTTEFMQQSGCPCIYKPFRLGQLAELVAGLEGA